MFAQYKNVLYFAIIVAALYGTYIYLFGGAVEPNISTASADSAGDESNLELVALVQKVSSVVINDGIFSDPTFLSLQDFSQELVRELSERPNPFEPFNRKPFIVPPTQP